MIKTGKMNCVNKGDMTDSKERLRFLEFLDRYQEDLYTTATTLEVLDLFMKDREVIKLDEYFPAFIGSYIRNALTSSVTTIYALFSNDKFSLRKFINYIKSNHDKIFTGDFYDITEWNDGTTTEKHHVFAKRGYEVAEECESLILSNQELIIKIKSFRDEKFAHLGDLSKLKQKKLELQELRLLFDLFSTIYNKIRARYDRAAFNFTPTNSKDVKGVAHIVSVYFENKTEINEILINKLTK